MLYQFRANDDTVYDGHLKDVDFELDEVDHRPYMDGGQWSIPVKLAINGYVSLSKHPFRQGCFVEKTT